MYFKRDMKEWFGKGRRDFRGEGSVCKGDCLLRALFVKRVICKEYCCKDYYLIGKNNIGGDNLIKHNIR